MIFGAYALLISQVASMCLICHATRKEMFSKVFQSAFDFFHVLVVFNPMLHASIQNVVSTLVPSFLTLRVNSIFGAAVVFVDDVPVECKNTILQCFERVRSWFGAVRNIMHLSVGLSNPVSEIC